MISHTQAESALNLGKLYAEKTDFASALLELTKAQEFFLEKENFKEYQEASSLLLRIYAEQKNSKKIKETKKCIEEILKNKDVKDLSYSYYCLAVCYSYEQKHEKALELSEKALSLALEDDSKEDICRAIGGISIAYYRLGRFDDALKQIYNLRIFFQSLDVPRIKMPITIMNGIILREQGQAEESLDLFWGVYEDIRENKDLYTYIQLLFHISLSYLKLGDQNVARIYLSLAQKIADPKNLKTLADAINSKLEELRVDPSHKFDLIFSPDSGILTEQRKGIVNFKSQFILMDLLKLFLKNPGEVYSKEDLVKKVWQENYDPALHDNKIYVTIKRLRKLLEPDCDKPKYIFRAKNGYYLNKAARVLIQ